MKQNLQMCKSNSAGSSENFKTADTCKVAGEKQRCVTSHAITPPYLSGQDAESQIRCSPFYNLSHMPRYQDKETKKNSFDSISQDCLRKDYITPKVECNMTIDVNTTVKISNKKFASRCSYVTLENNTKFKIPIMIDVDIHKEERERTLPLKPTKCVSRENLTAPEVRFLPSMKSRAPRILQNYTFDGL